MIEIVEEVLAGQQYTRIRSNLPYVLLYVKYDNSSARVIQLVDADKETGISQQQFIAFCNKAKAFIKAKGYEDCDFISIVLTSSILTSRKLAFCNEKCWILDKNSGRLIVYENQPNDFYGIKNKLEDLIRPISADNPYNVYESFEASPEETKSKRSFSINREEGSLYSILTPINTAIAIINILVFLVLSVYGSTEDTEYMITKGAMFVPAIIKGRQYYRFVTCMFLHFGMDHIFGNMVALLFLGDNVERAVGKIRYIIIYFAGGIFASFGSFLYAFVYNKGIVSAGASGAIFALIGALLCVVIKNKGRLENMTTPRIVLMIVYSLYTGFKSENVDMAAHIFGLFAGFLLAAILYRKSNKESNL